MNSENLAEVLHKGFRVTLGATTSLIEALQDPQKRDENVAKLNQEWSQLSEEWAEKGRVTEQEARNFVDTLLAQRGQSPSNSAGAPSSATSDTTPTAPPDVQLELQELTAQIAAIRAELERLRNQDTNA